MMLIEVYKTFKRRLGRFLNVLYAFTLRSVSRKYKEFISSSSHRRCSMKKDVLKNFAIFAVLESLFNKVARLRACNFIRKRLQYRYFPMNIAKFLTKTILKNICKRLVIFLPNAVKTVIRFKTC